MIEIYFDGACEPKNPGGNMGWGVCVRENGKVISQESGFVIADKSNSNNVAEYMAFIAALKQIKPDMGSVVIMGDSQLVVKQMNHEWMIRGGRYTEFAVQAIETLEEIQRLSTVDISIKWIPRAQNHEADKLSKREFQKRSIKIALS